MNENFQTAHARSILKETVEQFNGGRYRLTLVLQTIGVVCSSQIIGVFQNCSDVEGVPLMSESDFLNLDPI